MSQRRGLSVVPSHRDKQILRWLDEPEAVDAAGVLERVMGDIATMSQARPMVWDAVLDALRPAPIGRPLARAVLVLAALTIVAGAMAIGLAGAPRVDPAPAPNATDSPVTTSLPTRGSDAIATVETPSAIAALAVDPRFVDPPLELVILDGSSARVLATDDAVPRMVAADIAASLGQPAWHPVDDTVLVLDWDASVDQLWRVPTAGEGRSQVLIPCIAPCRSHNEASWSHDGSQIVMFEAKGDLVNGIPEACGLALFASATGTITSITSSPCAVEEERDPRFSPDDRRIAYWRSRVADGAGSNGIADSALFVRDLASGDETQVTDWESHASMLDWSPDGAWITYVSGAWEAAATVAELWRVRPDGSALERLTSIDDGSTQLLRPRYTPDGRWVMLMRVSEGGGELLAVPASGGSAVDVLPGTSVFDFDVRTAGGG